jgi:hypothetical protein
VPTSSRSDGVGRRRIALAAGALAFAAAATLNAGGYRYGTADQAFYIPAILHQLDPDLFPRDWAMLGAQGRFFFVDEIFAALVAVSGLPLPVWFALAQVVTLIVLYAAGLLLGRTVLASPWAMAAWLAALTLRHRIAKTGANTLEGYFHPRMLVFALGLGALALFMRGRPWWALAIAAASGVLHPTTAALFVALIGVAIAVSSPAARVPVTIVGGIALAGLAGGAAAGFFDLGVMDPAWLALIGTKDYVFPTAWTLDTWALNLLGPIVLAIIAVRRRALGVSTPVERGLVAGCLALVAAFLVSLPFIRNGVALAIQLQTSRVFWPVEIVATLFLVWWMVDRPLPGGGRAAAQARVMAVVLLILSVVRGLYVGFVETPARDTIALTLPRNDWTAALAWIRDRTPKDTFVLADPGHAWKPGMGTSVRIGATRDVFLEETKDVAMALYSRDVAHRASARLGPATTAVDGSAAEILALAAREGLTLLATPRPLDLPVRFQSGAVRVYALTP